MNFTGERFIPNKVNDERLSIEHWHRYLWASLFVQNKVVLDIACGCGYGSSYLAKSANKVYGFDINSETIEYAKENFSNVTFDVMSIDDIQLPDNSIDIITSFETIEHINEKMQDKAIQEFNRILKPNGILLLSTPSLMSPRYCTGNHFHIKELSLQELKDKLHLYFKNVYIIGQSAINCSVIGDYFINDTIFRKGFPDFAEKYIENIEDNKYLLAICSNEELNNIKGSILLNKKHLDEIITQPPEKKQTKLSIIDEIFSIKNQYNNNNKHKVLTIFGIKLKFLVR